MANPGTRITTREVAERLGCYPSKALPLLLAARIPHTRCGQAYLWDAHGVERLLQVLRAARGTGHE